MKQLNLSAISYMSSPSNYVLDKILAAIKSFMISYSDTWTSKCNAQKWSFPQRVSSVKVTKPTASCGFGHIYWWNLLFVLWCPRMQTNIRQPISRSHLGVVKGISNKEISDSASLRTARWSNTVLGLSRTTGCTLYQYQGPDLCN